MKVKQDQNDRNDLINQICSLESLCHLVSWGDFSGIEVKKVACCAKFLCCYSYVYATILGAK